MSSTAPFPDVLGYLTGGARAPVGVVQVALATRPAVVAAGDAFEVVLLVQNAADTRVDVSALVQFPRGFSGQNTRFIASVATGEVGIISMPVIALPDLNPGSHKIGVEVDSKPLRKAERLREASGGGRFNPGSVRADKAQQIEALKALPFSTNKRLARHVLETPVEVRPGNGKASPFSSEPGWHSLWTMADITNPRILLNYYGDLLRVKVISQLRREYTLAPLTEATSTRFAAAGFPLRQPEAVLIAKVMALVLEYAAPKQHQLSPLAAGVYDLTPFFSDGGDLKTMPRWAQAVLRLIARDERTALHVVPVLTRMAYYDLLRDAIGLSFALVETATGEDVGTDAEMREYADRIIDAIRSQSGMSLMLAYMPLILGGIIINEQLKTEDMNFIHLLREQWALLDERRTEDHEQGAAVLELAENLIERALQTYGFRRGST